MHTVRVELLRKQARAVGLPLYLIEIPYPCSDEQYATAMTGFVTRARNDEVQCMALSERCAPLPRGAHAGHGHRGGVPVVGKADAGIAGRDAGGWLRACITCVDPRVLPAGFAGRELTPSLLESMPSGIDPCGENGEFHTFVFDGPMFSQPLDIEMGEVAERDGFVFADCRLRPGCCRSGLTSCSASHKDQRGQSGPLSPNNSIVICRQTYLLPMALIESRAMKKASIISGSKCFPRSFLNSSRTCS